MTPLPLKHWLAIEEDVARHKAEIAQGFAELRERLLPEPPARPAPTQEDYWRAMMNAGQGAAALGAYQAGAMGGYNHLAPGGWNAIGQNDLLNAITGRMPW